MQDARRNVPLSVEGFDEVPIFLNKGESQWQM